MSSIIQEPLVIGYTCCGPTYRKSVYDKIKDYYFDDDNLYYCILTDDKSYFSDLTIKNLICSDTFSKIIVSSDDMRIVALLIIYINTRKKY